MNAGQSMTAMEFTHEDLDDDYMNVTWSYEDPEAVKPSRLQIESEQGPIFSQGFPFTVNTMLFVPKSDAKIITTVKSRIFTYIPATSSDRADSGDEGDLDSSIDEPDREPSILTFRTAFDIVRARDDLGGHRAITINGRYADKDSMNDLSAYAGVTLHAVETGSGVKVQKNGYLSDSSFSFMSGCPILIGNDGMLTQDLTSIEDNLRRVGWAVDSQVVNLDPMPPFELS